jgi:hypothetical protein
VRPDRPELQGISDWIIPRLFFFFFFFPKVPQKNRKLCSAFALFCIDGAIRERAGDAASAGARALLLIVLRGARLRLDRGI